MAMAMAMATETDEWLKDVLFGRGYLARLKGEAIKVYLAMVAAGGGRPDRSITISLSQLADRTSLSSPTIVASLARLERLGLVVSTTRRRGKVTTYYVADPPGAGPA